MCGVQTRCQCQERPVPHEHGSSVHARGLLLGSAAHWAGCHSLSCLSAPAALSPSLCIDPRLGSGMCRQPRRAAALQLLHLQSRIQYPTPQHSAALHSAALLPKTACTDYICWNDATPYIARVCSYDLRATGVEQISVAESTRSSL